MNLRAAYSSRRHTIVGQSQTNRELLGGRATTCKHETEILALTTTVNEVPMGLNKSFLNRRSRS